MHDSPTRSIRSFVQRAGRITRAQERALAELWPRFGIEATATPIDLDTVFGRSAPRVLEIGIGDGETLLALAALHPERDFLGVEVHRPGVGHCLLGIESGGLTNVRLIAHDAVEVLERQLPDRSLDEALLYFPDPWPKKRHHKRRFLQAANVDALAKTLVPSGWLHVATDHDDYWSVIEPLLDAHLAFARQPVFGGPEFPLPVDGALTNFEAKYEVEGRSRHRGSWRRR